MEKNSGKPFKIVLHTYDKPDKPHFYIYSGLMESPLFNAHEILLLIHLIGFSDNNAPNQVIETTISINKLSQKTKISKATVCKYIKSLEEKGVLLKKIHITEDCGYLTNTYEIMNFVSVWDCQTLEELKEKTEKIKREVLLIGK